MADYFNCTKSRDIFCLQGADHLTVTWKVDEGVYQHVDVREEGKENAFSLGRSLWIDSEVCMRPFKSGPPLT